ncbi:MAG TPA: hypothetical protein VNC14_12975 [Lapillicoccus sp.]|jgi:hypothetical protein|nr:hypothetical protein [Lapillicoccus sp.]
MTERSAAVKSAWAEGLTYFAVALLITVGIFQILQGLAAILDNRFYVAAPGHVFSFNITAWGWIHLVTGIVAFAIGVGLFYGKTWARGAGLGIAVFQAVVQFMFLPYYPIWSIGIIALDVAVIWALANYRSDTFM